VTHRPACNLEEEEEEEEEVQARVKRNKSECLVRYTMMMSREGRRLRTQVAAQVRNFEVWGNYKHISIMPGRMTWRLTQAAARSGHQRVCTGVLAHQIDRMIVAGRQRSSPREVVCKASP
jgi:uncharacterized protein YicC (UPF0701 family)